MKKEIILGMQYFFLKNYFFNKDRDYNHGRARIRIEMQGHTLPHDMESNFETSTWIVYGL